MAKIKTIVPAFAGALLGLAFIAFSMMYFLDKMPKQDPPPEGSAAAMFWGAMAPTGYLFFVKVCELVGGLLTAIPQTRLLGLLVLVPIIANIVAYHIYIDGTGVTDPVVIAICALAAFLLLWEHRTFVALVKKPWVKKAATAA